MPAAAVIPAPIAYIKVVAVKKLVVGFGNVFELVCRDGVYWSSFHLSLLVIVLLCMIILGALNRLL